MNTNIIQCQLPKCECPTCGYKLDAATNAMNLCGDTQAPRKGDISICIRCGEVLVFDERQRINLANINDLIDLDEDQKETIDRAQKYIRMKRFVE